MGLIESRTIGLVGQCRSEIDFIARELGLNDKFDLQAFGGTSETSYDVTGEPPAPVPEPATMLLLGSSLIGPVAIGRKRFFKKA